jgi:hypothetical protein
MPLQLLFKDEFPAGQVLYNLLIALRIVVYAAFGLFSVFIQHVPPGYFQGCIFTTLNSSTVQKNYLGYDGGKLEGHGKVSGTVGSLVYSGAVWFAGCRVVTAVANDMGDGLFCLFSSAFRRPYLAKPG